MTFEIPAWEPFDPSSDGLPESLQALFGGHANHGAVVVSAVSPTTEDSDWPALASVRLAEAFGAEGGPALLIDLGLEHPTLSDALGTDGGDGISDVFLFSASIQHVAKAVHEGSLLFASAGTVVGDPGAILTHPGWDALLRNYVESGTTVVLHVPAAADGADAVIARADAVVHMAGPQDSPSMTAGPFAGPIAWIGPPEEDAVADDEGASTDAILAAEANEADEFEGPDELAQLDADAGADEAQDEQSAGVDDMATLEVLLSEQVVDDQNESGAIAGPTPPGLPDDDVQLATVVDVDPEAEAGFTGAFEDLPSVAEDRTERPSRVPALTALMAVLVVVAVVLLFLLRGADQPQPASQAAGEPPVTVSADRSADPAQPDEAQPAVDATTEAGDAVITDADAPTGDAATTSGSNPAPSADVPEAGADAGGAIAGAEAGVMAYGLTINAHEQISAAREQATSLASRIPDLQFILVPVDVSGTLYFRVVAGPAQTAREAEAIRVDLREHVGAYVADRAIVRSTRWAFLLGAYDDRAQADERVSEALRVGVPAYIAEIPLEDGQVMHRAYAGGYSSEGEAEALRLLIERAELLPAPLTERIGRPAR